VQFVDRTLLRLADTTERVEVLSPAVGDRLLSAAFVFDSVEVGEVTGVSVRDIELLPSVPERQLLEGAMYQPANGVRWEASASLRVGAPHATIDGRAELFLTTETRIAHTSVEDVQVEHLGDLADLVAVDARIVADDGTLPADRQTLASRRFGALKTMVLERFTEPGDFDVDGFFEARGVDDIDELMAFLSPPRQPSRVGLELVVDGTLPSRIVNHRVITGLHIDEDPVSRLHAVVDEIQVARTLMADATEVAGAPSGMIARTGLPFVLVFAEQALDDDDLPLPAGAPVPGDAAARRAAHLTELQRRLMPLGIALAPISP
jgi:hypothetical protein